MAGHYPTLALTMQSRGGTAVASLLALHCLLVVFEGCAAQEVDQAVDANGSDTAIDGGRGLFEDITDSFNRLIGYKKPGEGGGNFPPPPTPTPPPTNPTDSAPPSPTYPPITNPPTRPGSPDNTAGPPPPGSSHGHGYDRPGHEHGPDEFGPDEHGPDEHGPDEHGPDEHGPDEHGPDENSEHPCNPGHPDDGDADSCGCEDEDGPDHQDLDHHGHGDTDCDGCPAGTDKDLDKISREDANQTTTEDPMGTTVPDSTENGDESFNQTMATTEEPEDKSGGR